MNREFCHICSLEIIDIASSLKHTFEILLLKSFCAQLPGICSNLLRVYIRYRERLHLSPHYIHVLLIHVVLKALLLDFLNQSRCFLFRLYIQYTFFQCNDL